MGILNVTPDSFSDGGQYMTFDAALARALQMVAQGADMIDIGGESTRPGSQPVCVDEELNRVIPLIHELRRRSDVVISVDTTKPDVAREALMAGADILNDVSTLRGGDVLAQLVVEHDAQLVLMHSRGSPADMHSLCHYDDVVKQVIAELDTAVERAVRIGVRPDRIWLDPGIGFAKTPAQSMELMRRLPELVTLGFPVLVGPSRKSFIGAVCGATVQDRLGGTAAAVALCVAAGAAAVRVHDVAVMKQVCDVAAAISGRAGRGAELHA